MWALEEAEKRATEESELNELARWPGIAQALANWQLGWRPTHPHRHQHCPRLRLWRRSHGRCLGNHGRGRARCHRISCTPVWVGMIDEEAERQAVERAMEAKQQAKQQLAGFQQAFPWMETPVYVDLAKEEEENDDA